MPGVLPSKNYSVCTTVQNEVGLDASFRDLRPASVFFSLPSPPPSKIHLFTCRREMTALYLTYLIEGVSCKIL